MTGRGRLRDYKKKVLVGPAERRKQLAAERREERHNRRTQAFTERRGLDIEEPERKVPLNRMQRLQEWKKGQVDKKVEKGSKPAFIVSKIKYNDTYLYRPPESTTFSAPKGIVPLNPTITHKTPKRTLRSHTKQNGTSQAVKLALVDFASAMKTLPKRTPRNKENNIKDELNRTFDGSSESGTRNPWCIPEEVIPVEDSEIKAIQDATNSEPCIFQITSSPLEDNLKAVAQETRRNSSRKSRKSRKLQTEKVNAIDSPEISSTSPRISVDVEKHHPAKSAEYFRSLHADAVTKLNNLCTKWNAFKTQDMPEDLHENVDVAVGYAQLLISQRLQQFADLILEHESKTHTTELKVLATDLDGFWGVVNNQVQDIYRKFDDLLVIKENNWKLPTEKIQHPKRNKTATTKNSKAKGNATSGLRSFLAHARRQAKPDNNENMSPVLDLIKEEKLTIKPMSPAIMRVSLKAKHIGSPQTPSRSPLKSCNRLQVTYASPSKSSNKTPGKRRTNLTPGTPLRRSARIASVPSPLE